MANIIAIFSRLAKSGMSALLDLLGRGRQSSSLDGSSSSSIEPTQHSALDDIQRIIQMLQRIKAMLEDAEEREIQDKSIQLWLSELRHLAYDIDDVIDEYEYDMLAAKMEAKAAAEESCHRGKHKRGDDEHHDEDEKREGRNILASSSSDVPAIYDGMAEKLREIQKRFGEIEWDRKVLRLREEDGVRRTVNAQNPQPTSCLVDESSVIGRESEKEEIVKLLLSDLESHKIRVIPIVGMGGMGKTTLAQLIYNDPRINEHFDLRKWIYVSKNFDLVKLTKDIYRSITNKSCEEDVGFDYLQDSIKKELMKFKRMFLVLDDVWNEKQCLWESLKVPFHGVATVNILFTTRNEKVADVMRTMNIFHLDKFSEDEGLQLFQQYAFCDDRNLMEIGKKIVNKCGGLPLAIKLLGSHLQFQRDEDKWMSILESELWELDPGSKEILPALRLSYERMPSHLKPCFRYCSIFPKDEMPDKNRLVWLWMAQGYIQSNIIGKTMEKIGTEYFDELLGRSFFQAKRFADSFKMHDLIFDLALFISGNEFLTMKLEGGNQNICISNNVRHIGFHDRITNNEELEDTLVYPLFSRQVSLRSIFYYGRRIIADFQLLDSMRLRALHIEISEGDQNSLQFLGSIASSKHLRYLGIKFLTYYHYPRVEMDLSSLLNSFHNIYNLQVLDLFNYTKPIMLPRTSIRNLINLRHLLLPFQSYMPCGISKLTCLQTLKYVQIKDGICECGGLGEIEDLASLTGTCVITNIGFAPDVDCFKKANITRKKHIQRLLLGWSNKFGSHESVDVCITFVKSVKKPKIELAEAILQVLRPHKNLKELNIYDYPGMQFPLWLGDPSWSKLRHITLENCNEWDGSGRVLDRDLPCLQSISIINCAKLKNIKIVQSSSLSRLHIEKCPVVTTLHGLCSLHGLEKLKIRRCCNLLISLEEILPSKLQSVCFEDCWKLTSITGLENLHSLEELQLKRCPKLKLSLRKRLSTMPSVWEIVDCPGLEEWCQRYGFKIIQELSKKEELTIKDTCKIISDYGSRNLVSLKELHIFESDESDFPKVEWIPRSLHTLYLNSCQSLMVFPPYQNLSTLRRLKIWCCMALTCMPGLEMMESLENLEIIECPQFTLSPNYSLPPKLQFLLISNCPSLLCLPGLEQLFSLRNLKLFECYELMLPPPEKLPFMLHVQLELFNSPKLVDWCQRYNIPYIFEESPKEVFVKRSEQNKLWLQDVNIFFENICVLDYNRDILKIEKWTAFRLLGFYICSCFHLKSISFGNNFTRLKQLRIWDCYHLQIIYGLENFTTLQDLDISKCPNLFSLNYCFPKGLQYLAIDRCNKLWSVYIRESNLSSLEISCCSSLNYFVGLQKQASLHFLKIYNCPKLCLDYDLPILGIDYEWLPDMLNPNNVEISACPQLQEWCQDQDVAYYTEEG